MPKPLFFASYLGFLAVLKIRRDYGAANSSFQGSHPNPILYLPIL